MHGTTAVGNSFTRNQLQSNNNATTGDVAIAMHGLVISDVWFSLL